MNSLGTKESLIAENGRNESGRANPVQIAFQQELTRFVKYMNRKAELGPRWKKPDEEAYARGSNTLFNLWNNFESRLPQDYYIQKLIATGDFLFNIKEYKIAQYHCYGRFLSNIRGANSTLESCSDVDMDGLNDIYLPNGLDDSLAATVLRALLGEAICSFHVKLSEDIKLKNPQTVDRCVKTLKILRLITQTALHKETFCWLVFNGTVHIYTACRHLMALGYSSKTLEFLLWACMCMESSVPLMTTKYLTWRCTLYTSVCQSYYDMKATTQAESFARRGLNKVNELEEIERISTSETTPMSAMAFREAKTKMQVMVFKRIVYETRKRPKGLLRPKTKPNLKDSFNQPWPRTQTERLLTELFQSSTSSQLLAVLEALSESRRRTIHCEAPPPDADDTLHDVCSELFFAGTELIAGGGGAKHQHAMKHERDIHPSVAELGYHGLIDLVREGSCGIPLQAVIKFVKLAFSYEQWETFNQLVGPTLELLREQQTPTRLLDIKTLELMMAMEPFYSSVKKPKKTASFNAEETADVQTHSQAKNTSMIEDLLPIADVLHSCSLEPYKSIIGHMDMDMIIDAALFLWSKCKIQFQRIVSSSMESCKYLLNDSQSSKWMYLITVIHTALSWSDACTFDPILFAEVALKLALVLECKANLNDLQPRADSGELESPNPGAQFQTDSKQDNIRKRVLDSDNADKTDRCQTGSSESSKYSSILGLTNEGYSHGVRGLLAKSCDVLNQGFQGIGRARDAFAQANGKDIVDSSWIKESTTPTTVNDEQDPKEDKNILENMVKALHIELLFVYQRVAVKHAALGQDPESRNSSQKKTKFGQSQSSTTASIQQSNDTDLNEIMSCCDKNPLSKALVLMHKAGCAVTLKGVSGTEEQTQLLKESIELIQKAQQQDRKLLTWNKPSKESASAVRSDVPPPPVLLYRSPTLMIFKPAPFEPSNDKVAWYRLFARSASGNNIKVRLNDYQLPGTGEETPATSDCTLMVKGLKPNQRYVFALAAYNNKGQIIGKTIGTTSRPVLAAHSLPTLMAWGYLAQIAYTVGVPSVAKSACSVLWNHFVTEPKPSEEENRIEKADQGLVIRLKILDENKLQESSSVLIRLFLQSVFISVDLTVRENFLYCNSLCDNGPLYSGQVARLHECERLLLAIQVAGWLNDTAMCLQAIVQCYGLLAPMVQQQLPAKPVIQILLRCHAVLQEVPSLTRHRRQTSATESLSHMIATMTYFIAKTLHNWGEKGLSGAIVELGKKMLHIETAPDSANTMTSMHAAAAIATSNVVGQQPPKTKKRLKPKLKGAKGKALDRDLNSTHDVQNEELKSLEAYITKLSQKALHREDDELTGSEDPSILHSYVASLPTSEAYKEVLKFKRRTRFLEFFVQVVGKAIDEGQIETSLEWSNDAMTWIIRRNEMVLANKPTIVRMAPTVQEDEKIKRFATAIVEFGKTPKGQTSQGGKGKDLDPDEVRVRTKLETARPPQSKPKSLLMSMRRTGKLRGKTEEEVTIHMAAERLQLVLPDYWRSCNRRKKLRSVSKEELPWKVQLNMMTAGCNLEMFLEKVGALESQTSDKLNAMFGPSNMDPDWFSFSTSGTLIISWAGTSRRDSPEPPVGFSGSVMEIPPYASPVNTASQIMRPNRESQALTQADVGRAGSRVTAATTTDKDNGPTQKSPLVYLGNAFSNLTRSIVLAHRGKYWTMLQNACRRLWNTTQTILIRVVAGSLRLTDDPQGEVKTDIDILRGALWKPFFTAVDCLMDMIVHLQADIKLDNEQNKKHDKLKKGDVEISRESGLMAGVEDEKGGSSLRFDIPLDNNTILDTRWVKSLVLYAAEMMFYEGKWERVVDVILRFNALSRSRYAESVLPMLIIAQRKLAQRVKQNNGPSLSQPVIKVSKESGVAEEFMFIPAEYEPIEPGVHLDPVGHDVYSGSTEALRLVSVPIDINESLSNLRQALDLKHHTARVLEHSRKMLLCYLAGQQKGSGGSHYLLRRGSSRVGFVPTQVKPPTDVPVDLTDELYESIEDITTYTLQPSQLAVVISSYDKTIEMLQFRQQRGLAAQAMHELGNIMFHTGNTRMAYKWWAEALDSILNTSDSLKNWRDIAAASQITNPCEVFLQRCGIWGCLLAAVLASNIAQYIHTSNLGLRQECCLLSATLFKALFVSSLPHPTADKDYALYDIGYGCEMKELLPGIDLLSDVFRSDGRSVVAALTWVTEELARARHLLIVLPLVTLSLYFTCHVCRDVQRTVDIRILRVRVLTDLGLYSQAITVLSELLNGERLPRVGQDGLRTVETKNKKTKCSFANNKPLTDANNLEVINDLLESRLSPQLTTLYGPQLSGRLKIVYAHVLVAMATTIYAIPENMRQELDRFFIEKAEAEAEAEEIALSAPVAPPPSLLLSKKLGKAKKSEDSLSVKSATLIPAKRIIEADASPAKLKGFLLCVADLILEEVCEAVKEIEEMDIEQESFDLSPSNLELLVLAKLELSQISLQRHHAVTAGSLVYSAMRSIEDAAVLNELGSDKRSPSMFNTSPLRSLSTTQPIDHFLTSQSRSRLDARLWLTCRLFLVKSLIEEDSGMGKLGGSSRSVTARIGSCEHHCRQGFDEAEAFGDVEMAAEFTMLDFVHSLQHGKISDELISKLEELIIRLERCQTLSYSGQLLLMLAVTQYTDINKPGRYAKDLTHIQDPLTAYQQAASILLKQLVNLGECIDRTVKSPVLPLQNIFLQHINLLIEVKLRLGRVLTHGTVDQNGNTSQRWIDAVRELELGLELVRRSAYQRKPLTAHILFSLGQVQKHMVKAGLITNRMAANSFIKAIQQTFVSDHDLGLIKQAYMEISSVYMSSIKQTLAVEEVQGTPTPEPQKDGKTVKTDKKEARPKTKKSKDGKEKLSEFEKEKRVIWSAVRGATLVSMAQHRFALLTGEPEITALKIKKKAGKSIPMFALFDLLGTDDIISYSGRDSFLGKDGEVTFGTEVNGTNTVQITWIQMLGYLSLLRRQCSYKALGVGTEEQNPFAIAPLFSSRKTQKLSQVHLFLKSELVPYAEECCGVFPIDGMTLPVVPVTTQTIVTQPTEAEIERLPTEKEEDPYKYFALVQGMSPSSAREFEVSVYWSLQPMDTQSRKDSQTPKDTQSFKDTQTRKDIQTPKDIQSPKDTHPPKVAQSPKESQSLKDTQSPKDTQEASQGERWAFMYALNTKSFNMASNSGTSYLKIGLRYLPVKAIQTLHEGLMNTLEVAENEFQPVPQANVAGRPSRVDLSVPSSQEAKSPQAAVPGRKKRTVGIRALSARQRREDVIRNKLKEHLDQIHAILNTPEEVAPKEFPFEVNLQNIVCLEAIFDPSRGYTTRPTEAFFNWLISVLKKY